MVGGGKEKVGFWGIGMDGVEDVVGDLEGLEWWRKGADLVVWV